MVFPSIFVETNDPMFRRRRERIRCSAPAPIYAAIEFSLFTRPRPCIAISVPLFAILNAAGR